MKIKLEQLTKSYGDAERTLTVIEGLSFEFPETGTVAITGRSGVGKSTLLNMEIVDSVVKEVAAEKKARMIIDSDPRVVIYSADDLQITDEVIERLDNKKLNS